MAYHPKCRSSNRQATKVNGQWNRDIDLIYCDGGGDYYYVDVREEQNSHSRISSAIVNKKVYIQYMM